MSTFTLSDTQWSKIVSFLKTCPDIYTGQQTDLKRFIHAVLWITRSGSQWRLLPNQYGNWNSVYKRFARWCDKDIFQRMHQHFVKDPDMEWLIIDSISFDTPMCWGCIMGVKPHKHLDAAGVDSQLRFISLLMA